MMNETRIPIAVHTFLISADSVLLLRRFNTGFEDGNYGLVGGHLEGGESVTQAAIRECREEVGVEIDQAHLRVVGVAHYDSPTGEGIDFFLTATRWTGEPRNLEPDFCDELRWCRVNALPENTVPFVRRAVEHHLQARHWFDELGWG
jgi:ADP-ribose pyrophosphatase YjhB (NUDIX family)